jgi:murein DD-endopeptidase MepM/ murein hydrolase activator NlpD
VGLTGFTTGPHLHIEMRDSVAGSTVLALYEALDPLHFGQTLTCYEPKDGDVLFSNNNPQP